MFKGEISICTVSAKTDPYDVHGWWNTGRGGITGGRKGMFQEALSDNTLDLIDKIAGNLSSFYLAGGTGLALQLGHRISEDLDLFSEESFDAKEIEAVIARIR